jgi:hypothetical protein
MADGSVIFGIGSGLGKLSAPVFIVTRRAGADRAVDGNPRI